MKQIKLAIVVSHPIQHFCPQYESWAKISDVDLTVFFGSMHGLEPYEDEGFGRTIQWNELGMDFPHQFLPGADTRELDSAELEAGLSEFEPALVIMYGYSQPLQRRALRWAKRNKVPTAMISDAELRTKRNPIKAFIKKLVLPRLLRGVDSYLTVGDANEQYYRHFGATDNQFVRCFFPIDVRLYDNVVKNRLACRKRVRGSLGIPEDHKVILNVGKFIPLKRQLDLVKLSNSLKAVEDKVTVILAGTGREEQNLRTACVHEGPGGVIFAGFVPPNLLAEYYCAADIYVHCSDQDRHSLAISEAVYTGLPIVLSHMCGSYGPTDEVRTGLNGFVYCCGDVVDLQRKTQCILDTEEVMQSMGEASREIGLQSQRLAHQEALPQLLRHLGIS